MKTLFIYFLLDICWQPLQTVGSFSPDLDPNRATFFLSNPERIFQKH